MDHGKRSLLLLLLAGMFSGSATAQVLIGSSATLKRSVLTLGDAGPKWVDLQPAGDSLNMWNLDMSLYRTLHLPALPPNYGFLAFSYFTRDLFDNDTGTVEFLAMESLGPVARVEVIREDGSVLFTQDPGRFPNLSGMTDPTWQYIFSDGVNTYLQLDVSFQAGSNLYLLPGHLPCNVCGEQLGSEMSVPAEQAAVQGGVYPNPASEAATVRLGDLRNASAVVLVDQAGRTVKRIPIAHHAKEVTIATTDVPAGAYTYYLETEQGIVPGSRLLVVR